VRFAWRQAESPEVAVTMGTDGSGGTAAVEIPSVFVPRAVGLLLRRHLNSVDHLDQVRTKPTAEPT
jgi:hypothetical protein